MPQSKVRQVVQGRTCGPVEDGSWNRSRPYGHLQQQGELSRLPPLRQGAARCSWHDSRGRRRPHRPIDQGGSTRSTRHRWGGAHLGRAGKSPCGSVIRAANDTAPLVLDGITEFTDQLPLIAGFASAYAEVNAEQTQKVVQTFSRSLSCNLECDDMTDPQEKAECEEKYCKELEEEDDYDYRR